MMKKPQLLGIVNITRDSFSDGMHYLQPEHAIAHAKKLHQDGADIIDLGPCASSPNAEQITAKEEISRITPVIEALQQQAISISIDSYQSETQLFGLEKNISFLNDIRGFSNPAMYERLQPHATKLIVMHSVHKNGVAEKTAISSSTILDRICRFFEERLKQLMKAGIAENRLIIDPGMGWFLSTDPDCSLHVLKNIAYLKEKFGLAVLISVSRKSFLRNLTNRSVSEILPATLVTELFAIAQGADYIRTHDVKALNDALIMAKFFQ